MEFYNLVQFHYHTLAENQIDGVTYDAEVHFVHVNPNYNNATNTTTYQGVDVKSMDSNQYVVIGLLFSNKSKKVLFKEGKKSIFDTAFEMTAMNKKEITLDLTAFNSLDYLNFEGSLTSAPFTSSISWWLSPEIFNTSIEVSRNKY